MTLYTQGKEARSLWQMFFKTASLCLQKGVGEQRPTSGVVPSPHSSLAVAVCEAGPWCARLLLDSARPPEMKPGAGAARSRSDSEHLEEVMPSREKEAMAGGIDQQK